VPNRALRSSPRSVAIIRQAAQAITQVAGLISLTPLGELLAAAGINNVPLPAELDINVPAAVIYDSAVQPVPDSPRYSHVRMTIVITHAGKLYKVTRFTPHEGRAPNLEFDVRMHCLDDRDLDHIAGAMDSGAEQIKGMLAGIWRLRDAARDQRAHELTALLLAFKAVPRASV
jgi:hypothetical protein